MCVPNRNEEVQNRHGAWLKSVRLSTKPSFCPTSKNPTFSPRIDRIERIETRLDFSYFILNHRLVQGEVSAENSINTITRRLHDPYSIVQNLLTIIAAGWDVRLLS